MQQQQEQYCPYHAKQPIKMICLKENCVQGSRLLCQKCCRTNHSEDVQFLIDIQDLFDEQNIILDNWPKDEYIKKLVEITQEKRDQYIKQVEKTLDDFSQAINDILKQIRTEIMNLINKDSYQELERKIRDITQINELKNISLDFLNSKQNIDSTNHRIKTVIQNYHNKKNQTNIANQQVPNYEVIQNNINALKTQVCQFINQKRDNIVQYIRFSNFAFNLVPAELHQSSHRISISNNSHSFNFKDESILLSQANLDVDMIYKIIFAFTSQVSAEFGIGLVPEEKMNEKNFHHDHMFHDHGSVFLSLYQEHQNNNFVGQPFNYDLLHNQKNAVEVYIQLKKNIFIVRDALGRNKKEFNQQNKVHLNNNKLRFYIISEKHKCSIDILDIISYR